MTDLALTGIGLFTVLLLWLCWGIVRAIRDVLAERAADWLLPPQQPVTFRFAQFLAFLSATLAPRRYPQWELDPGPWPHSWYLIFPIQWRESRWSEPEAVLAELESDLRAEQQVLDPVRLVLPLLIEAVDLRLFYLRRVFLYVTWIPLGLMLYPLLMAITTVDLLGAGTIWRMVRRRLRRWGSGAGR